MQRTRKKKRLWLGMALLAAGGATYLLFRADGLLLAIVLRAMGLGRVVVWLQGTASGLQLPEFFVYNLPGGLWSAAYILLMDEVGSDRPVGARLGWAAVIPFMGVASEALQAIGLLPGTADAVDAACYALPFIIYVCVTKLTIRK